MTKPEPFMYIIRSIGRDSGTPNLAYFRLNGLPTKYRRFKVEVVSFYRNIANVNNNVLYEIRTDLPIQNGYDTSFKRLNTIATSSSLSSCTFEFIVENFNGRTVSFFLYENDDANDYVLNDWVLYLKMTGIDE